MSLPTINLVNIGLMLGSAALAFVLPFETFLLAYAVLGPLHYLTQISWLHERNYFTQGQRDWIPLAGLTVVMTVVSLFGMANPGWNTGLSVDLILWCLGWSLITVATKDTALRVAGGVGLAVLAWLTHGMTASIVFGGLWLPTIVHVFVFTGLFILYGCAKSRSVTGWLSFAVFLGCGALTLLLNVGNLGYEASPYVHETYTGMMGKMHVNLMNTTKFSDLITFTGVPGGQFAPWPSLESMLSDDVSIRFGRFIAFAYTYHYLNWFSKTSVIRWHEVPKSRLVAVVVIWLLSIGLYAIDYGTGLRWLLLLSFAHVILEFPLDWKTILAIPRELMGRRPAAS